jgi:hypothetical protein
MKITDEFGKDPTVQRTRKLFSMMEKMDKTLFESLQLTQFDERLRTIRETRQDLYEKAFSRAMHQGFYMDEEAALLLFNHCQKIAVTKNGFSYPFEFKENPGLYAFIKEESA